jgi:hypothetical protein
VTDNVYRITHLVGSSSQGVEDAIRNAIKTASQTVRNMEWFEVTETRGHIADGDVAHFQVVIKVGFRYERE